MIILFIESFNPCSYGSSVLTDFKSLKLGDIITIVSILVLMDLPFLHDSLQELAGAHYNGFNPCSYGSSVLTLLSLKISKLRILCFNPCSYGSSVLTRQLDAIIMDAFKFQSLFLWIFRSYLCEWLTQRQKGELVSILVLMDLPFLL